MQHIIRFSLILFAVSTLLVGCKTSNDVASNGWIQKRKHLPGFHFNLGSREPKRNADKPPSNQQADSRSTSESISHLTQLKPSELSSRSSTTLSEATPFSSRIKVDGTPKIHDAEIAQTRVHPTSEEPTKDRLEQAKKNNRKRFAGTAAGFVIGISLIILGAGSITYIILPIAITVGMIALLISTCLGFVFLAEWDKLRRGRTVFTEKNRNTQLKMLKWLVPSLLIISALFTLIFFAILNSATFSLVGILFPVVLMFLGLIGVGLLTAVITTLLFLISKPLDQ